MTRDQLAKVFPSGRTLHVSTDGPLSGYEQAQADSERNGERRTTTQQPAQGNAIASLFNRFRGNADPEETEDASTSRQTAAAARRQAATRTVPAPVQTAAATAPAAPEAAPVPLPLSRPTFQIASAEERPVPAPARPVRTNLASPSPNQIIEARGFDLWCGEGL